MRLALIRGWPAALVLAVGLLPAHGQKRPPPDPYSKAFAGGYELSSVDGARRCLVLLRPEEGGRRPVGFPPPCRRALPVLAGIAVWKAETTEPGGGGLRLVLGDGAGGERLVFAPSGDDHRLVAEDGASGRYHLKPMAGPTPTERAGVAAAVRAEQERARTPAPATDQAAMGQQAGRYHLLRQAGRDSGCRLDLMPAVMAGEGEVRLQAGCQDRGVIVFAPARWHIAAGTLWLLGPRGKLSFERDRKGQWHKGPGQGEPLTLAR